MNAAITDRGEAILQGLAASELPYARKAEEHFREFIAACFHEDGTARFDADNAYGTPLTYISLSEGPLDDGYGIQYNSKYGLGLDYSEEPDNPEGHARISWDWDGKPVETLVTAEALEALTAWCELAEDELHG